MATHNIITISVQIKKGSRMKTENKLKLAGVLLGATLITATAAVAGSHGNHADKVKSEQTVKKTDGKCGAGSCGGKKATKKSMDANGTMAQGAGKASDAKCGAGKCG